jgi:hypothetical protein
VIANEENWMLLCYLRQTSFHLAVFPHSKKDGTKELLQNSVKGTNRKKEENCQFFCRMSFLPSALNKYSLFS